MCRKIVIIGPESTGKSTLCQRLSAHYHTLWCPEYAREYLLKNGAAYNFDDLARIAQGQIALEDSFTSKDRNEEANPVFFDTNLYVIKVWCEFVFDKCHRFILNAIAQREYDLYLLCNTDLPWQKDPLREYPDLQTRQTLFKIYKDLLVHQHTPWVEIKGTDEERFEIARATVDLLLNGH